MKRAISWIVFLCVSAGVFVVPGVAWHGPRVVQEKTSIADLVAGALVQVGCGREGSLGSGTVLEADGEQLVLTAAHVVDIWCKDSYAEEKDKDGNVTKTKISAFKELNLVRVSEDGKTTETNPANVVWYSVNWRDAGVDLALVKPSKPLAVRLAKFTGKEVLRRGEDVWYCGCPKGVFGSLERTIVNRPRFDNGGREYVVVNGNGWYGNSGCGVYVVRDGEPRLVGVVVRLAWTDARTPLLCENQDAITDVLKRYVESKEK